jgi:hypothetical protein
MAATTMMPVSMRNCRTMPPTAAAHYFPDAYFFCAEYGLRRGQVDEVDSGNDQDEEGNAGQCK